MKEYLLIALVLLTTSCSSFPSDKNPRVILTLKNTVTLIGPVDAISATIVIKGLVELDAKLPKGEPIYIALRTPGGSVFDGLSIIQVAKSLNREVKTITFEAASMGFMIAQHLGERLAIETSMMMSHRVSGSCRGNMTEIDRCVHIIQSLDLILGKVAAARLKMTIEEYMMMIHDEKWWIGGEALVNEGAADRVITPVCDKEFLKSGLCPMI